MTKSLNIPLQFFAEGAPNTPPEPEPGAPQIDYEKLAGIVEGKQRVAEDTVLKRISTCRFKKSWCAGEWSKPVPMAKSEATTAITASPR